MDLYYAPNSIALAAHIALSESGLPYGLVKVDHHEKQIIGGGSYLAINPNGYVPALKLDDGTILTECAAILQYIADIAPNRTLCPPLGTTDRYRVSAWVNYVATELHQTFMRFTQTGRTPEITQAIHERLKQRFGYASEKLEGRDVLIGTHLSIADIFLYVATRWCAYHAMPTAQWPALHAAIEKIRVRPNVMRALAEEGLEG